MSRNRPGKKVAVVFVFRSGEDRPYRQTTPALADKMSDAGTARFHPADHTCIEELPDYELLRAAHDGKIRGPSCSYSGGIPGQGFGKPDEYGRMARDLSAAERLADSPTQRQALAEVIARERCDGAQNPRSSIRREVAAQ